MEDVIAAEDVMDVDLDVMVVLGMGVTDIVTHMATVRTLAGIATP